MVINLPVSDVQAIQAPQHRARGFKYSGTTRSSGCAGSIDGICATIYFLGALLLS